MGIGELKRIATKKGVQFHSTCNLCRDSHKTQVWLCFLLLGFLCRSSCAAGYEIPQLQTCLEQLKNNIYTTDAMLYAPSVDEIKNTCERASLICYMLELRMVLNEVDDSNDCISNFLRQNEKKDADPVRCPACETYSIQNITIFLERLKTLLEKMNSQKHM